MNPVDRVIQALTPAITAHDFVVIYRKRKEQIASDGETISRMITDELRIVRQDRHGLRGPRDVVPLETHIIVSMMSGIPYDEPAPEAGTRQLELSEQRYLAVPHPRESSGNTSDLSSVDVEIEHVFPFPDEYDLAEASAAMLTAREQLITAFLHTPPAGWNPGDHDQATLEAMFQGFCQVLVSGGDDGHVELNVNHIWGFDEELQVGDAELNDEMMQLMGLIRHVWWALLPSGYEHDPLAPVSIHL